MVVRRAVPGLVLLVVVVMGAACAVESVQASSYDRSCKTSDDCVLVDEIIATKDDCTIPCERAAIAKKAKDKYDSDYEKEEHDCATTKRPTTCSGTPAALCVSGKCVSSLSVSVDGGTD